ATTSPSRKSLIAFAHSSAETISVFTSAVSPPARLQSVFCEKPEDFGESSCRKSRESLPPKAPRSSHPQIQSRVCQRECLPAFAPPKGASLNHARPTSESGPRAKEANGGPR